MSVVVIGDANVDLEIRLPSGEGTTLHANPEPRLLGGGSAANTAAALARLEVRCRFAGTVGDDSFGRFAVDSLETAGVNTNGVHIAPDAPTVTVVTVIPPNNDRLIYVWPSSGGAHGALQPRTAVEAAVGAQWLHVSGICLRVSPSREAVLAAMSRARADGIPVSFDLNLRLENWGWNDDFHEAVTAAVRQADVVLGGAADEIGALAGNSDPIEAARSLATQQRLVVARLGAAGAVACFTDRTFRSPGIDVEAVDTVGAGDAFDAGFIAARLRGIDVADALRWGNVVAGLTITQQGARSTPALEDVIAALTG